MANRKDSNRTNGPDSPPPDFNPPFAVGDRVMLVKPYTWEGKPYLHDTDDLLHTGGIVIDNDYDRPKNWHMTQVQWDIHEDTNFLDEAEALWVDADCLVREEPTANEIAEALASLGVQETLRLPERHCPTCTCGCTCGYGGFHEPENPRCYLNGG